MPQIWKSADVCPLPKVPAPYLIERHLRPISLTPVLSKCLERFVTDWIMESMQGILDPHQFGSLRGSSTVHALVELIHQWQSALDTPGKMVRVVMLDFSKAFDRVDHAILLRKFTNLGLPNFLVKWLTSFLCQRQQRVKIGSHMSDWAKINAGVPQGTLTGPVGFLLHINDLQTICNILKYVDDSSIWEVCAADCHDSQIQVASDQASTWSARNHMVANIDKTKEMAVTFSKKHADVPHITIGGKTIERTDTFKLLGVVLSSDLTWGQHVEYMHGKCSQRLYLLVLLKRAGVAAKDILCIYTSMIRSVIDYACPVWHTSLTKTQSDRLESIQKRAFRIIHPEQSYSESLQCLGMQTLHQRREELSRAFFACMMDPSHKLNYLLPKPRNIGHSLRHQTKYPRIACKHERYKNTLIPHGLAHWQ